MDRASFDRLEAFMRACMRDSAHDREHVYRVLYTALDIAAHETNADLDVLIAACLLHDVGRAEQMRNAKADHALVGAEMALRFLLDAGYDEDFARRVAACIAAHRYRSNRPPESLEAKILFDADKLDATGAMGYGLSYMHTVSLFYILMGMLFVPNGMLRGAGDMGAFTLSSMFNLFSRVAMAYALAYLTPLGANSIWWSIPAGWAVGAAVSLLRVKSGKWMRRTVADRMM